MNTSETSQIFRRQVVALLPRLRRFARNLTRHPQDADDVVQIAVERALLRSAQWRAEERLDSWLFKIVRNTWIDEVRSRRRQDKIFLKEEAGADIGRDSMEDAATLMSIQAAMGRLAEDQREAVSLVLIEGLPYREAADVLEIPIGTLTSRLARGRDLLQSMLAPEGLP